MKRILVVVLLLLPGRGFADASVPDGGAPFTCAARLETARTELLHAGFNPAKDTESWLKVNRLVDGGLLLNVYTEYSPDGDGYRTYEAELHRAPGRPTYGWRFTERKLLDEFKEERLPERTWTRARAGWVARIHTRTEDRNLVRLFERIVRPALQDCLNHPGT